LHPSSIPDVECSTPFDLSKSLSPPGGIFLELPPRIASKLGGLSYWFACDLQAAFSRSQRGPDVFYSTRSFAFCHASRDSPLRSMITPPLFSVSSLLKMFRSSASGLRGRPEGRGHNILDTESFAHPLCCSPPRSCPTLPGSVFVFFPPTGLFCFNTQTDCFAYVLRRVAVGPVATFLIRFPLFLTLRNRLLTILVSDT